MVSWSHSIDFHRGRPIVLDAAVLNLQRACERPIGADRMRRMVGFRNVAVHEYRRLDPAMVRTVVAHRRCDVEAFCRKLSAHA
jgi:uncharacterized protein YutE (UPF0331/DUF86 family)